MRIVISQPMYFPWLGQINQALLADAFVFYSDVQFSRGFINRVQILIDEIQEFITVPTIGSKRSSICQLVPDPSQPWQAKHLNKIQQSLGHTLYGEVAINIFKDVVHSKYENLAELSSISVKKLCEELFPSRCPIFYDSTQFSRSSRSTMALIDICKQLGGTHYLTGHGAINYIDSSLFNAEGIELEFIEYEIDSYPQAFGKSITPYVSSLDAIARIGRKETCNLLNSKAIAASKFLNR